MSVRRILVAVGVGLLVFFGVIQLPIGNGGSSGQAQQTASTTRSSQVSAPVSQPTTSASSATPTTPGSSTLASPTPSSAPPQAPQPAQPQAPVDPIQPVAKPDGANSFTFTLQTTSGNTPTEVASEYDVPSDATEVAPPELPGCPWTTHEEVSTTDVPSGCDWSGTSLYVKASGYPVAPAVGTVYVYAHSCVLHLCPMSLVQKNADGTYTVQPGYQASLVTPSGTLGYTVCAVGSSPKKVDRLVDPTCDGVHIDLEIVTCEYEEGVSNYNIVVALTLTSAVPR